MSLYRRNGIYYAKFDLPNGGEIRRSSKLKATEKNRRKAKEWHDRMQAELWNQKHLGLKPQRSWKEAVVKWMSEHKDQKSIRSTKCHLRWLDTFLRDMPLHKITRDVIEQIAEKKEAEGVSNATVNRHLEVVRAILRAACYDWEWIEKAPKVRMRKEPSRRVRYLTKEEHTRLLAELPSHLSAIVQFATATGLRAGNIVGLQWANVDMENRIAMVHGDEVKNGESLGIYLNADAMAVLDSLKGKHKTHVFSYRGKPINQPNTKAWREALKRAGIKNFRFHDLRHTWASWHVQNGTPLFAVQEQGGWKSPQMVRRYAHLSAEHFAAYGEKIAVTPGVKNGVTPKKVSA